MYQKTFGDKQREAQKNKKEEAKDGSQSESSKITGAEVLAEKTEVETSQALPQGKKRSKKHSA